jgi:hypothetical protein
VLNISRWACSIRLPVVPHFWRAAHVDAQKLFLFDHLVGAGKECMWNRKAQCLRGLEVDHQLELRRLLYRKIGRLCPIDRLVVKRGRTPSQIRGNSQRLSEPTHALQQTACTVHHR